MSELEEILYECIVAKGQRHFKDGTPYIDLDTLIINRQKAVDSIESYISKRERLARIEAISSLPKIKNGQYYFVSGKDIDKRLTELEKLNLGDK